jgi:integrase
MSLEQARAEARELVKTGKNPSHERQKEKQAVIEQQKAEQAALANSFEAVAREWMERQQERWSKSHAKAVRWKLEHDAFPFFGDCPADAVTPPMFFEAVRSIEERGALEMARKALERINAVFRYLCSNSHL